MTEERAAGQAAEAPERFVVVLVSPDGQSAYHGPYEDAVGALVAADRAETDRNRLLLPFEPPWVVSVARLLPPL
jgi:hypothetical protein